MQVCDTYAELCARTNFSFLKASSHPEEMVERAAELGLPALGLTDLNGVYGAPKAFQAAKSFPTLKLIIGAELRLKDRPSLILLSMHRKAYGLLCRMLTALHAGAPKGEGSLTWFEFLRMMSRPGAEGLICIPHDIKDGKQTDYKTLKNLFDDRIYLPISRLLDGYDRERITRVLDLRRRYEIPILATNEARFHEPSRRKLQDILISIDHGVTLESAGTKLYPNAERYLKSPLQMKRLFKELPEALTQTLRVAERCIFKMSELRYRYPSEWIPEGESAQSYLEKEVWKGAKKRYPEGIPPDVLKQLKHELNLVEELVFADYFLTIWEIVEFARSRKILCQGRGSAANSIVCYCLGITAVDPVRMNLLFERFLSAERGEPPDIDVDFEHERREEVIQHIYEKYGRDRAAMVSAVVTYRSRSAIREISKVLGKEISSTELKLSQKKKGESSHASVHTPIHTHAHKYAEEIQTFAQELKGFPRHLSIHSGGFTLSADPIIEIVPIEPARMEGRTIIQWDKYDLDYLGLLKIDVLSLGMLTATRKTLDLLGGRSLASLPAEDRETYKMIQRADTVGTFQIESRAQMNMLGRLKPETFYDLVIEVAIVRPGPIVGQMVHPYLKRRRGEEPIVYHHPKLKAILGKTLGVPLFQEQVMKMAIDLADFTPGEADSLRRAIGAWRSSGSIQKIGERLMKGLLDSGLPEEFVLRIFEQIKGFAEYGFPESHAASFAFLAYASSYLKCHHPAEFLCSMINSQPLGFYSNHSLIDDAKRHGVRVYPVDPHQSEWDCVMQGGFSEPADRHTSSGPSTPPQITSQPGAPNSQQIAAHQQGHPQAPQRSNPHAARQSCGPNPSWQPSGVPREFGQSQQSTHLPNTPNPWPTTTLQNRGVRLGFRVIKGLWKEDGEKIIEARKKGRFKNLNDFISRTRLKRDSLEVLAMADVFERFGMDQRNTLWRILGHEIQVLSRQPKTNQQIELFDRTDPDPLKPSVFKPMNAYESLQSDYRTMGLSLRGHPMRYLRQHFTHLPRLTSAVAKKKKHGAWLEIAGMIITRQHPSTAAGTTFATLEDEEGFFDMVVHKNIFERYEELFLTEAFMVVRGIVHRDGHSRSLVVKRLSSIWPRDQQPATKIPVKSRDFR